MGFHLRGHQRFDGCVGLPLAGLKARPQPSERSELGRDEGAGADDEAARCERRQLASNERRERARPGCETDGEGSDMAPRLEVHQALVRPHFEPNLLEAQRAFVHAARKFLSSMSLEGTSLKTPKLRHGGCLPRAEPIPTTQGEITAHLA
jgi:hypothetical protein